MQNKKKLSLLFLSLMLIATIAIPLAKADTLYWYPTNVDSAGNAITDTTNFSWVITFDNGTEVTMSSYTQGLTFDNSTDINATVAMTFEPISEEIGTSSAIDFATPDNITADITWNQVYFVASSPIGVLYNGNTQDVVASEGQVLHTFTMTVTENDGANDYVAIWYGNKAQNVYQVQCQGAPLDPVPSLLQLGDDTYYNDMNAKVIYIDATERSTTNTYTVKFQAPIADDPNTNGQTNSDGTPQGMTILDGETNLGFITLPNLYIILGIIALVAVGGMCIVLTSKSSKTKKRKK